MKLFSANRTNRRRHNPCLAFYTLGDRIVPTIATPTLSGGVLTVTGDSQNDNVRIYTSNTTLVVHDRTRLLGGYHYFTASQVNSIVLNGGEGNDYLKNETSKPTTFSAGHGNDTLLGGSGNDTFYTSNGDDWHEGGAGNDTFYTSEPGDVFYGGAGSDVLDRTFTGQRGYFRDGSTSDLTIGQVNGRLTAAEYAATGGLTVRLDPANNDRLLLTGPSGTTLVFVSDWYKSGNSFRTNGAVSYEVDSQTTVQIVPAVQSISTVINLTSSPLTTAGNFSSVTWAGLPVGSTNPLTTPIDSLAGNMGVDVTVPNVTWGLGLGKTIRNSDTSFPLNDAVPYFYKLNQTGGGISTTNASLSVPGTGTITFAYSPVEGSVYVKRGNFAMAVSTTGSILYKPTTTSWNLSDPNIFGHVYLQGSGTYKVFGMTGKVILDLDANDNGYAQDFSAANMALTNFANWKNTTTDGYNDADELGGQNMWDIAIGFTGDVDLSLMNVLTIDLGTSTSIWFKPGELAFAATVNNPLKGLPVLSALGSVNMDVQGQLKWTPGTTDVTSWGLWARAKANMYFGTLKAANMSFEASSARNAIHAWADVNAGRLGTLKVEGDFGFNNTASLTGKVSRYTEKNVEELGYYSHSNFETQLSINWINNNFRLGASFNGEVFVKQSQLGEARAYFNTGLSFSVSSTGALNVSGSGTLGVSVWIYWPEDHYNTSLSFAFDNDSFTVDVPLFDTVTFEW